MKKALSVLALLVLLISFLVGEAQASSDQLTLLEARSHQNGNTIIVFRINNDIARSEFRTGSVNWNGQRFNLSCKVDGDYLYCDTTNLIAGQYVYVTIGGYTYYTYVIPMGGESQGSDDECYPVYRSQVDESESFETWVQDGEHCPDEPPSVGDEPIEIDFDWFEFLLEHAKTCSSDPSPSLTGYFYICYD